MFSCDNILIRFIELLIVVNILQGHESYGNL